MACHLLLTAAQEIPTAYGAHEYGAHHPGRGDGVEKLVDGKGRQGYIDEARHLVAHGVGIELAAHGILHPRVGDENPPCRDGGTQTSEPCRGEVEATRHLLPAEIHDGNKGALHEERHDALDGKRGAEDVAHKPGVVAPVGAELKLEDDARSHAHGEVDAKQALPEHGGFFPEWFTCAVIARFHNAHDEGQTERERHKEPMVDGCKCKLRTRPVDEGWVDCQQVCHCL